MRKNLPPKLLSLGKLGETLVCNYLLKKHYRIVDRNSYLFHGELDIVTVINNTTVFVEVKTRTSTRFGEPVEAVTKRKLGLIIRTAELYLQSHPTLPQQFRIDVVSLLVGSNEEIISLRHDENVTE